MQDWLYARAQATPQQPACIIGEYATPYADLNESVGIWCNQLSAAGIRSGQRVAVLLGNSWEYVGTVHALARLGATIVPLNTRLSASEIRWQLENTACTHLITSSAFAGIAPEATPNNVALWSVDYSLATGTQSLRDVESSDNVLPPSAEIDLDATQAIVFTSGTSGQPKGAEITFGNHFYSAMASAHRLGHHADDRWLSVLPLYHVGGLAVLFRCTLYGTTVVLHDKFDINEIQHSFDYHAITMISLVPTRLHRMLEAGVRWPDSLRLVLLGGAAATPELLDRAKHLPIAPTYGLTEATSQVATAPPGPWKPGSVGRPLMFTSVEIVDEEGQKVPRGQYGEVVVRGPTVMKGYHNNPEATAKTLRGGLHTGDIGYLDEDGDLFIVQRRSDLIVTGGENVYPAEVEGVLRKHPAIDDVAVVGIDDPEWGQRVAAAIVCSKGTTEDEIITYAREHLAGYKVPRVIMFVDAFPQTASGKVQRKAVVALFG